MIWRPNRRELVKTLAMGAVAGILPGFGRILVSGEENVKEVHANSFNARGQWYFDPAGLFIEKGQYGKVRLNGLAIANMSQSPKGETMMNSFGNWEFSYLYIDEKANADQRAAL